MHYKTVGAYEAKTHLPVLLDTVSHGEKIVITRRGIPIAILIPYQEPSASIEETIESIFELRANLKLKGLSIRNMREEGRK